MSLKVQALFGIAHMHKWDTQHLKHYRLIAKPIFLKSKKEKRIVGKKILEIVHGDQTYSM